MSSLLTDTTTVNVTMPQMGVSVAEGTIVAWHVAVGDTVSADQTVCEVSTDKIDTEVPAPAGGVITELCVELEQTVNVGTVLARISTGDAPTATFVATPPTGGAAQPTGGAAPPTGGAAQPTGGAAPPTGGPAQPPAPPSQPAREPGSAGGRNGHGVRYYSPVVQRIAAEHHIDLDGLTGTGLSGRVTKRDVLAAVSTGSGAAPPASSPPASSPPASSPPTSSPPTSSPSTSSPSTSSPSTSSPSTSSPPAASPSVEPPMHIESPYRPDPEVEALPAQAPPRPSPVPLTGAIAPAQGGTLSRMRRQIGEHMKRSLETAATCTTWIEADMTAIETARQAAGLTALPYVAAATVVALRAHPALNATLEGERYTVHAGVNLGIAVSLGEDGLIVPVIHNAHELSVDGLSARIKDLARRARSKTLTPDEVRGATFTITNPGQYGSIMATPVLNQPQVGILDLEAVVKRPVVLSGPDGSDVIGIRSMTILGLSWDHRALDGVLSAQFLATLRDEIQRSR